MKKLEVKIFENFRTFDEKDKITFKTELPCRNCLKVSGNYILIEGWIRICQGCLNDWMNKLQKNYLDHVGNARRKGE
jgi:hypothetical protein